MAEKQGHEVALVDAAASFIDEVLLGMGDERHVLPD